MGKILKRALGVLVILALAGGIVYLTSSPQVQKQLSGGRRGGKAGADEVVPVVAAAALRKDVPIFLDGVGTARARNSVTVKPQVDGKILSINFREGQDVKKGDLLAKIDPVTYQAQLDQALAKRALDEAQLANAKRDLERYSKLNSAAVAEKTVDTQRALVAQLTAQLQSDDAAIANARAILGYTDVVAPIDGRTGIRLVDQGNLVRSGDAGIVTITEVKPISVIFTLPQQELPRINAALAAGPVMVEATDSDAGKVLDTGKLQVVDNQVDQTTGTVRLKAEFPNASLQLWPGQFVNVKVLVDTLKQVVVVPVPAIQRGPSGTYVFAIEDGKTAMRLVTVAQQTDKEAVLTKGLEAGQQVVTNGFARLRDGSRVSTDTPAPAGEADSPSAAAPSQSQPTAAFASPAQPVQQGASEAKPQGAGAEGKREGKRGEGRRGDGNRGEGRPKRDASTAP